MIVRTSTESPTVTAPVSDGCVRASVPPRAVIDRRPQYSPSGVPGGGETRRRTVCCAFGASVIRRGNALIHAAAERSVESGASMTRSVSWPVESVTG
jgi:hypothetical protein